MVIIVPALSDFFPIAKFYNDTGFLFQLKNHFQSGHNSRIAIESKSVKITIRNQWIIIYLFSVHNSYCGLPAGF